jgi:ABC-type lipopolysaccharide export system ATPase subunit
MYDGHVLTEGTAEQIVENNDVRTHYLGDDFTL